VEVVQGDARNVLCDAVDRHRASVLVLGSHDYGAIKRYLLINYTLHYLIRRKLCFYFLYFRLILLMIKS